MKVCAIGNRTSSSETTVQDDTVGLGFKNVYYQLCLPLQLCFIGTELFCFALKIFWLFICDIVTSHEEVQKCILKEKLEKMRLLYCECL